ncbi:uncharacterized protein LOC116294863 [Actinia tenebrosa]|uniref:Uncharacterized protein LOC116294863 n=1 Tax=Actinia tenebrosa TaxID=6105 RepID=A0A6P8HT53_ACTTE|nr:uncharacterized protein LOC116294863 [Actinia tenebrosa]
MLFKLLCLSLLCCIASCTRREQQTCGEEKFYCPSTKECLNRDLRCTNKKVCVDLESGQENNCFEERPGRYRYYKKQSPLLSSGSSKSKRLVKGWNFKHWFLEYRGFAYEFGTYGHQELDVNDPNYKYGPGREKVVKEELLGTSSCTRDDVLGFRREFMAANPKYKLHCNNCQTFVEFLAEKLKNDCSPTQNKKKF